MSGSPAIMQDFASRAAKAGIRLGPAPPHPPRFPGHGVIDPEEMKRAAMKLIAMKRSEEEERKLAEKAFQKLREVYPQKQQQQQQQQHTHKRASSSGSSILIKLD
ncbi:hypothetical protein PG985_016288 [Apiospora marii]|uniref:Uncharacterized protein n=1 Tax=Apiospora marii TaxID=335849 RepID=A0ABR1SVC3_9PEZI